MARRHQRRDDTILQSQTHRHKVIKHLMKSCTNTTWFLAMKSRCHCIALTRHRAKKSENFKLWELNILKKYMRTNWLGTAINFDQREYLICTYIQVYEHLCLLLPIGMQPLQQGIEPAISCYAEGYSHWWRIAEKDHTNKWGDA